MKAAVIWKVVVMIVLILFAAFVWPTRYSHYKANVWGGSGAELIKMDRITGKTWFLAEEGWVYCPW